MRVMVLTLCGIILAGCQQVVDVSALPSASAAEDLAVDRCYAEIGKTIKGAVPLVECELAAQDITVKAVRLTKMDIYEAYKGRMRLLAQQFDAGAVDLNSFLTRLNAIRADFKTAVWAAYGEQQDRQARTGAALAAMGAGLQQAGASYNAPTYYAAPPQNPVVCTTTPGRLDGGGAATTVCH